MNSLIERVLSVEDEAADIIEKARTEAKELEKQVKACIVQIHNDSRIKMEERMATFRTEALRRHEEALANQEIRARKAVEAVKSIPDDLLKKHVEKIVNRFREM